MSLENNKPIDFVIIWVDGNDPEWRKEKAIAKKTLLHLRQGVVYRKLEGKFHTKRP